ncbi:hypothetical protein ACFYYB_30535 [Streptomyces sp. NPDC002886]|uniref:hypothetical protein n=1 Tax=Streptomyces sp. NPDC002886 TaxID=3364667 RepID=UPI00368F21A1
MGQKTVLDVEPDQETEKKKLDLSVAQVAGSSLATVAAAVLASGMGLYGTIIGAGIVSVVATAGGPVIQHFFRRTGDQLRETARPKARQVPVAGPGPAPAGRAPDGTMMLGTVPAGGPSADEEFGAGTVHGTRVRGWKRTAVASGAAFAIALGGLGTYEAVAGTAISADGGTILTGGTVKARDYKPKPPKDPSDKGADKGNGNGEKGGKGGKTPDTGTSPSPSHPNGDKSPKPDPDTSPSADPSSSPSPAPPKPDPSPTPTPPKPDPSPSSKPPKSPTPGTGQESPAP